MYRTGARRKSAGKGQVLVEVLLVLPVFLFVVFTIMEIGFLAFHTILIHHAAYESARFASLTAKPDVPSSGCVTPTVPGDYQKVALQMFPGGGAEVGLYTGGPIRTLQDKQEGCDNYDVAVQVSRVIPMVFPLTGIVLANTKAPDGRPARRLTAIVRMPIERPLFK